jgi:glyoxylase-like metal-dependent hydrolase (beta-lactamase superfamily II)
MAEVAYDILIPGFPARSSRGFLGWSTVTLLHAGGMPVLVDTGGQGDRVGLLAALAARGLAPGDIRLIVLSHLHFDHIANIECFPDAELVVHQDELAYYQEQRHRDPALPVFQIEAMLARSRLQLINGELEVLSGVTLLRTPGHTGGHCSVMFKAGGRTVMLAQDAIKHRGEALAGEPDSAFDMALARQSIRRIMTLADIVVPGHDGPLTLEAGRLAAAAQVRVELTVAPGSSTHILEV